MADAICRYCLDGPSADNPFLGSPLCRCAGTGADIHARCFRRWYRIQLDEGQPLRCPVCKGPYRREHCPALETLPPHGLSNFMLSTPILMSGFLYYIIVFHLFYWKLPADTIDPAVASFLIQRIVHVIYVALFAKNFKVNNFLLYIDIVGLDYCVMLLAHTYLWPFIDRGNLAAVFVSNFLLGAYWQKHIKTLKRINEMVAA